MASMTAGDDRYDYTVAWVDLMATGATMGRSVITSGRFARVDDLPELDDDERLAFHPLTLGGAPPVVPNGLLNRLTIRAFNELWYRKAPRQRRDEVQTIGQFFHPLDGVRDWNRLYGPRGFLQWQIVIPFGHDDLLRSAIEQLSTAHCTSFLAVLKRFGPANEHHLSFPLAGWTLSLDIPAGVPGLSVLLDHLDDEVAAAGGRTYLAKDSRVRPDLLAVMYPRLDEWRAVRDRVDPRGALQSDLGRRLGLC
jgi:decaprenylphospho-beta-D-ribofuranose 2-oxidase